MRIGLQVQPGKEGRGRVALLSLGCETFVGIKLLSSFVAVVVAVVLLP